MENELSRLRHGEGGGEQDSRRQRLEAVGRALDHVQYAKMDSTYLPAWLSRSFELVCSAQESLLDAAREELQSLERWDKDGHAAARSKMNLKKQALHQLQDALKRIEAEAQSFIDTNSAE